MSETLVNRIADSGLITLKPEEWVTGSDTVSFDLKDFLFQGLILKEKDFREQLKLHNWSQYAGKILCVFSSVDAIIPNWAYMLIGAYAAPVAKEIFFGTPSQWISARLLDHIRQLDVQPYKDQRVIIKGCTDELKIGPEIYLELTKKLVPVVRSLMFGEPCSTVPVFKRGKEA